MTTSEQWIEEAAALKNKMLAAGGKAGIAKREQVAGLSGLQTMQAMLDGKFPFPHIAETLDFMLFSVSEGEAIFQGTPSISHMNPLGSVHGGWYGTLLDSAMGCAVHTTMPVGRGYTTADYTVNLMRGVKLGVPYRVIGKVLHAGKQLAMAEAKIVDAEGKLYAHGTTTCLVFELPKT